MTRNSDPRYNLGCIGKIGTHIEIDGEWTRVVFRGTPILSFNDDKIILKTGGWRTSTTKKRMNEAAQRFLLGYSVFSKGKDANDDSQLWVVDTRETHMGEPPHKFDGDEIILDRRTLQPIAQAPKPYDVTGGIIAYEDGTLDDDQTVELFQHLVDSGLAWQLQGSYGRMAAALIEGGHVTHNANPDESPLRPYRPTQLPG